jgi:hypothetical protein
MIQHSDCCLQYHALTFLLEKKEKEKDRENVQTDRIVEFEAVQYPRIIIFLRCQKFADWILLTSFSLLTAPTNNSHPDFSHKLPKRSEIQNMKSFTERRKISQMKLRERIRIRSYKFQKGKPKQYMQEKLLSLFFFKCSMILVHHKDCSAN